MKKNKYLFPVASLIFVSVIFFVCSTNEKERDTVYHNAFLNHNKIFSVIIPEQVDFAGESVPMDLYYIRESLDRELTVNAYWHSSTIFMIKRANRWFPVIEPILKQYGIPDDFKYLALAESGLQNVVSPSGATGFWQILEGTGRELGLEINANVDERYHIEKSTEAACKFFLKSYELYHDWTLVAASYNAGRTQITDALQSQKVNRYYDLLLSEETSRYLFRVLALKTILTYPTHYGFYLREKDLYQPVPYKNIEVQEEIPDLADFAQSYQINYRILKEFNPWLRQKQLNNKSRRVYYIKIPEKRYLNHNELIKGLDNQQDIYNDTVQIEQL